MPPPPPPTHPPPRLQARLQAPPHARALAPLRIPRASLGTPLPLGGSPCPQAAAPGAIERTQGQLRAGLIPSHGTIPDSPHPDRPHPATLLTPQVKDNFERFISSRNTIGDVHARLLAAEAGGAGSATGASTAEVLASLELVRPPGLGW